MDIQTKDGILLRGIPDGTPDEVIKARIAAIRGGGDTSAPAPDATLGQKVLSSSPARFIKGLKDPIDAGAQFLAHASPDWLTSALDYVPSKMRNSNSPLMQTIGETFFSDPRPQSVDRGLLSDETEYQKARQATAPKTMSGQNEPGFDLARLGGNLLSPVNLAVGARLPAAAMSTAPRMVGTGAGLGVLGGITTPVLDERGQQDFAASKGAQVGLGAVTGAIMTPVLGKALEAAAPYVQRAINSMTGVSQVNAARASLETDNIIRQAMADIGQKIDDLPKAQLAALRQQVNESLKQGTKIDAGAALRKQDFDSLGLPFTQGQITRDPMMFAREKNLRQVAGVGEPLLARLDAQAQGLQQKVGALSAGAIEQQQAGGQLVGTLKGIDESLRQKVSTAYTAARESAGKDLDVPLQGLAQDIEGVARDYGKTNPAVQWARSYFKDLGVFGEKQTKTFTFEDAEQALQAINKNASNEPAVKNAFGEISKALKGAIKSADDAGGAFAAPRALAAERFDMHDAVKALGDVADGSAPVDRFVQRYIIGGESRDAQSLAKFLSDNSPESFQQARSQMGAYIQRAAFGENLAGDKAVSPERLARVLREIGTEKLSAFFNQGEIEGMKRMARVSSYINSVPANAVPNTSGTASALLNAGAVIPGMSPVLQIARAIGQPIANQRAVSSALSAQVPQSIAPASPELIRRLQMLGAGGGLLGSVAAVPR